MASARPVIVVTESYAPTALDRLRTVGDVRLLDYHHQALRTAVADATALLVRTYTPVTADLLDHAPGLRVIGRAGVGLDNIDLTAATARGITVVHTPAASTCSVAEHTLGLLLAVEHRLVAGDQAVRTDAFESFRTITRFRELGELTLGIIGMGRIGTTVARMASTALGMSVLYNDIRPVGPFEFPTESVDKPTLLRRSDVISLHVPLTDSTRGLVDTDFLARCRPGSILLNTARGAVVDSHALADHLRSGHIAGAGLDVTTPEPLPPDHPLATAPNTVFTPHVASRSGAALARMNDVVDDVIRVLRDEQPLYPADPA